MSGLLPVAVYGLKVPAGDVMVPSLTHFPATFRLTMAAIDPTAEPENIGTANGQNPPPRATLKLVYDRNGSSDEEGDESDEWPDSMNFLQQIMQGGASDEDEEEEDDENDSSSDDEEVNGGPSDPSKSKKARKQAAADALMKALAESVSDDDMDVDGVNGASSKKKNKGKAKALSQEDEVDSEDEEDDDADMEEVVVCTLDPSKNYQQPLDLTIGEDQRAYFKVSGTHAIYLTGNYVVPAESSHKHEQEEDYDDDSMDYDLSPGEEDEDLELEDESDELDNLDDPRITEVHSDEEEVPKLVKNEAAAKKGKNKRPADDLEDEPASLDGMMAKVSRPEPATNGEPKLSKKQMKKLKNNAGKAVEAAVENKEVKKVESSPKDGSTPKADKKVQFAKNLEQGPSGTTKDPKGDTKEGAKEAQKATKKEAKAEAKAEATVNGETPKASLGTKVLQGGVKIDDRKLGTGPACKKGNKVGMRYIGKLKDGRVFDANKKGAPFTFKLGTGEVIKGWDIGVAGMSAGGERRIEVPANLAYGSKSMPGIPANSALIFDVKLLTIN